MNSTNCETYQHNCIYSTYKKYPKVANKYAGFSNQSGCDCGICMKAEVVIRDLCDKNGYVYALLNDVMTNQIRGFQICLPTNRLSGNCGDLNKKIYIRYMKRP
jgi:hypothetical protein